ncbi:MAG: hypothetical protein ACPGU9_05905 [Flavobacteriaceae bacterium]
MTGSCYDDDEINSTTYDLENSEVRVARGITLVFGRYYGKCQGNACVELFMLQENTLREDNYDDLPVLGEFYSGNFIGFKGSEQVKIESLLSDFPQDMLYDSKSIYNTIGQPDNGDWGALYLEYHDVDIHKQFLIDIKQDNIPKAYRNYMELINATVDHVAKVNTQH